MYVRFAGQRLQVEPQIAIVTPLCSMTPLRYKISAATRGGATTARLKTDWVYRLYGPYVWTSTVSTHAGKHLPSSSLQPSSSLFSSPTFCSSYIIVPPLFLFLFPSSVSLCLSLLHPLSQPFCSPSTDLDVPHISVHQSVGESKEQFYFERTVFLRCISDSNPPVHYSWKRNNQLLTQNADPGVEIYEPFFTQVKRDHFSPHP